MGKGGQVVLGVEDLQVGHQAGALADQPGAAAQQVARLAHAPGVGVGHGEVAAAQERGELVGVEFVVLGLAAVNRLQVKGVPEHERDVVLGTKIGDPVPSEHAFATNDKPLAVRLDRLKKGVGLGDEVLMKNDGAGLIANTEIH